MTSDRPYRTRLSDEEALMELAANAGSQFDPAVIAALIKVWPQSDDSASSGVAQTRARSSRTGDEAAGR